MHAKIFKFRNKYLKKKYYENAFYTLWKPYVNQSEWNLHSFSNYSHENFKNEQRSTKTSHIILKLMWNKLIIFIFIDHIVISSNTVNEKFKEKTRKFEYSKKISSSFVFKN